MLVIGAKGHAKDLILAIEENENEELYFFDEINTKDNFFLNKYKILKTEDEVVNLFRDDPRFILGIGNPITRKNLYERFMKLGGAPHSVISKTSTISNYSTLNVGLNILPFSFISAEASIGIGVLVNCGVSIHHNALIRDFVEIGPGAKILGNCTINELTFIGAGATILPKIIIGRNCIVGANSVVNKNLPENVIATGVPAKVIRKVDFSD